MNNVINLPTYEQVAEILTEVLAIDLSAIGTPTTPASNVLSDNAHAKLNWLLTTLNTVNTNLGTPTTAASNANSAVAHSKLNWLLTNIATVNTNTARGAVKSVQRGFFDSTVETSVTISTINMSKSIFIPNNRYPNVEMIAYLESATKIRLKGGLYWQVIEFY